MTVDEILAEIEAAYRGSEGQTMEEWAEQMGVSVHVARRKVKLMLKHKKMAHGKAKRTSMRNQVITTDVYRIL